MRTKVTLPDGKEAEVDFNLSITGDTVGASYQKFKKDDGGKEVKDGDPVHLPITDHDINLIGESMSDIMGDIISEHLEVPTPEVKEEQDR